jgi:hypothetical protein
VQTLESISFWPLVRVAVAEGLEGAAILDVDGKLLAIAGALDDDETHAIAAVITNQMRSPDVLARMLDGELIESTLGDRMIGIGIAARCVFVVIVPSQGSRLSRAASEGLCFQVERLISQARADFSGARPPVSGPGGSSSGPAQLPAVEWGITVRRKPSSRN